MVKINKIHYLSNSKDQMVHSRATYITCTHTLLTTARGSKFADGQARRNHAVHTCSEPHLGMQGACSQVYTPLILLQQTHQLRLSDNIMLSSELFATL